tara:strand:+ start:4238 stop:4483 length:246 start_codon:yes stop_codon:yes gene_type:complete
MKYFLMIFSLVFAFSFNAEACPYQKMAEVDSKLFSNDNKINTETFAMVSNLRSQGEEKLQIGDLDKAELIFDRALSLLSSK